MLFVWVVRLVVLFAILTVIYVILERYYRWDRRKALEAEFKATAGGSDGAARTKHVAQGMSDYDRSLKKKLILGVYLLPLGILVGLILIANFA